MGEVMKVVVGVGVGCSSVGAGVPPLVVDVVDVVGVAPDVVAEAPPPVTCCI